MLACRASFYGLIGLVLSYVCVYIAGWVRLPDEEWSTTMSRMKSRVQRAEQMHRSTPWSELIAQQQSKFVLHLLQSKCE